MINLLPPTEKQEIKEQEVWRRVFIILFFLLISLMFLALIFYALGVYVASSLDSSENLLLEKKLKTPEFQEFQRVVSQTNQNLSKIQNFLQNQILVVPLFEKIASLTPPSVYFTNFSFQKVSQNEVLTKINISGWAKTREDLFYFKENLEKEKSFKNIYFLPSSWISPVNANFSLSFSYDSQ